MQVLIFCITPTGSIRYTTEKPTWVKRPHLLANWAGITNRVDLMCGPFFINDVSWVVRTPRSPSQHPGLIFLEKVYRLDLTDIAVHHWPEETRIRHVLLVLWKLVPEKIRPYCKRSQKTCPSAKYASATSHKNTLIKTVFKIFPDILNWHVYSLTISV